MKEHPDLPETYFHPVVDSIISLLASDLSPDFYVDDTILEKILEVLKGYDERDYSRIIYSSISHARNIFMSRQTYNHPIFALAENIQNRISELPDFLTGLDATSPIPNWPSVEVIAQNKKRSFFLEISFNDLAKFQTHLSGSNNLYFYISIPHLTNEENKKLLNCLIKHICEIKEFNLLGSNGAIRLPALLKHKPNDTKEPNPKALAQNVAEFLESYCKKHHKHINFNLQELTDKLLLWFKDFAKQYCRMSYGIDGRTGLALFEHIKILKLLYQTLSCKPTSLNNKQLPNKMLSCLWQKEIDKVLVVLGYTLRVAVRTKEIYEGTNFKNELWSISQVITNKIARGESVILQLGTPKLVSSSGHTFYIILKSIGNNRAKIIIVDGGDRNILDPQYDPIDKGFGCRILSKETIGFDLNSNKEFLKNYIYKSLMLRYESCNNEQTQEEFVNNIKLKNKLFLGRNETPINNIPTFESAENSHSFISQNFEDCTMSNLREAFRIFFEWNPAEMANFISSAKLRYNFLLYQNDHHITAITQKSQQLLEEKAIKSYEQQASIFLLDNYANHNHLIENVDIDGNCFYHSIALLLKKMNPNFMVILNRPESEDHIGLRNAVVEYLRKNTSLIINEGFSNVEEYLNRISNHGSNDSDGEWADTIQLRAMLSVIQNAGFSINNIVVHSHNNQLQLANNNFNQLEQQNIMHLYNPGNHYMPIIEDPNNPIGLEIDRTALEYEAIVDNQEFVTQNNYTGIDDFTLDPTILSGISGMLNEESNR